jgi:hypothetical protein
MLRSLQEISRILCRRPRPKLDCGAKERRRRREYLYCWLALTSSTAVSQTNLETNEAKVKLSLCFNWTPRHEDVLGEWRYTSTHSLTSALDGGEWSASYTGRFTPRERAPGTPWTMRDSKNFKEHDWIKHLPRPIMHLNTLIKILHPSIF